MMLACPIIVGAKSLSSTLFTLYFPLKSIFFISKIRIRDRGSMFRNEVDPDPGKQPQIHNTAKTTFNLFPKPSSTEYSVGSTAEQELLLLVGR